MRALEPLAAEERWEAIEAAERFFRDTRVRVSTEHIGLARHPSGLELVRIGAPMRPEFAAWRYGDQFGRRLRRRAATSAVAVAGGGALLFVGISAGLVSAALLSQVGHLGNAMVQYQHRRTVMKLRDTDGSILKLKPVDLGGFELIPDGAAGPWSLRIGFEKNAREYTGAEALRVAAAIVPRLNAAGATGRAVKAAVQGIDAAGGTEAFLAGVEAMKNHRRYYHTPKRATWDALAPHSRLALEMALHEEQERRALEGELKELELAWRAAEEIAQISDDLLLPDSARRLTS